MSRIDSAHGWDRDQSAKAGVPEEIAQLPGDPRYAPDPPLMFAGE